MEALIIIGFLGTVVTAIALIFLAVTRKGKKKAMALVLAGFFVLMIVAAGIAGSQESQANTALNPKPTATQKPTQTPKPTATPTRQPTAKPQDNGLTPQFETSLTYLDGIFRDAGIPTLAESFLISPSAREQLAFHANQLIDARAQYRRWWNAQIKTLVQAYDLGITEAMWMEDADYLVKAGHSLLKIAQDPGNSDTDIRFRLLEANIFLKAGFRQLSVVTGDIGAIKEARSK
ncbi:MAG: hypothetical protein Q7T04_07130 [Dehalococcoidia bacterium]|nr:hypothetical protein [Dehalococcoidia bacterium]